MSSEDATVVQPPVHEFEDDWVDEESGESRRRLLTPLAACLAAAVLIGIGVFAGVVIEKHYVKSSSAGSPGGGFAAARAGAGGAAGGAGGGATAGSGAGGASGAGSGLPFGGGVTVGQVSMIRGKSLYVKSQSGNTVKIKTSSRTSVTKSSKVKVTAIYPGDTITVLGSKDKSGALVAASISLGSTGLAAGGATGGPALAGATSGNATGGGASATATNKTAAGTAKSGGKNTGTSAGKNTGKSTGKSTGQRAKGATGKASAAPPAAGGRPATNSKFASCLAQHGVKLSGGSGGSNPFSNPKFQKAMQACQRFAPQGGRPAGAPGTSGSSGK